MQTLSPRLRRVVRTVTEAMFNIPDGADPDRMRWYLDDLDEFLIAAGVKTRFALKLALFTLQFSPLLLTFRLRRFSSLPLDQRIALLERYELSPMSILMAAIKLAFSLVYFEHPRTLAEYNLDPRIVWPGVEGAMGIELGPRRLNPYIARRVASESQLESIPPGEGRSPETTTTGSARASNRYLEVAESMENDPVESRNRAADSQLESAVSASASEALSMPVSKSDSTVGGTR